MAKPDEGINLMTDYKNVKQLVFENCPVYGPK